MRPRSWLRELLRTNRREIFGSDSIPFPLLSLHVRHSDKGVEEPLYSLREYMESIQNHAEIRRVRIRCAVRSHRRARHIRPSYTTRPHARSPNRKYRPAEK